MKAIAAIIAIGGLLGFVLAVGLITETKAFVDVTRADWRGI